MKANLGDYSKIQVKKTKFVIKCDTNSNFGYEAKDGNLAVETGYQSINHIFRDIAWYLTDPV